MNVILELSSGAKMTFRGNSIDELLEEFKKDSPYMIFTVNDKKQVIIKANVISMREE